MNKELIPPLGQTLKQSAPVLIGMAALVYFIFWIRWENQAPYFAILILFAAAAVQGLITKKPVIRLKSLVDFVEESGKLMAQIVAILAPLGMILGALGLTGSALAFTSALSSLSGGNVLLLLLLAGLASFILGMGLPVSACYVFLALLVGPALVESGIYPLSAHLFILYYGLLSFITPPVALSAYAASTIAQASPIRTGFTAMRLGAVLFFLPFIFVYSPGLVLHGSILDIITAIGMALLALVFFCMGVERYVFGVGPVGLGPAVLFLVAAVLLIVPVWQFSIAGLAGGMVLILLTAIARARSAKTRAVAGS